MCHQSVGLIQSIIENIGIPTVSISLLREITEKVKPPRALFVPYVMGYPLGEADNEALQLTIVRQALSLLTSAKTPPFIEIFHSP
jgi:D-proline reductase (dithiol) PrdB